MKFLNTFVLIIFSFLLLSCESNEDSVLSADNLTKVSPAPGSSKLKYDFGHDLVDLDDVLITNKEIDGTIGGTITLDTLLTNLNGNPVRIQAELVFEPNSFTGTKNIIISADPSTGSIKFLPSIIFNQPAKLNLNFKGINLARLGFDSNTKADFVYISDNGTVELIQKNECKIKWNSKELYVKSAKLQHFSRYIFVR